MEKYLRVKDLAQATGIKQPTWRKWIQQGNCPVRYRRTRGKRGVLLFSEADVADWIQGLPATDTRIADAD